MWLQWYEQLLVFNKKRKHLRVPSYPPYDKLYNWLLLQKENQHTLSPGRRTKLNEIGTFRDGSLYLEERWQQRYKELQAYKRRYKDCRVPAHWKNNPGLAKWVTKQRSLKRIGKLLSSRKKLLDDIGFIWSQSNNVNKTEYYDKVWEKKYRMLEKYYREYGHSTVVHEWKENPSLARWVADQRMNFKKEKLSNDKINRLAQLDFLWNPLEAQWMESFYQLKAFYIQHGHTRIPTSVQYLSLSKWASYTRTRKKELSKEKIALMDSLSFQWKISKRKIVSWEKMYQQVIAYKKKYRVLPISRKDNPKLAKWLYDQRTERVKHSPERRALLTKIGIEFRSAKTKHPK